MKVRDSRRRRFQVEALERRETLSTAMGGAALAAPAVVHVMAHRTVHVTKAFKGSGTATLIGFTVLSNGSTLGIGTVNGSGTTIGAFGGMLQATLAPSTFAVQSASGEFTASDGSQLNLTVTAHKKGATYKITGGTGTFAGAKGSGTMTGSVNAATHTLSFAFKGTVTITK
jgi:hypothetical protein